MEVFYAFCIVFLIRWNFQMVFVLKLFWEFWNFSPCIHCNSLLEIRFQRNRAKILFFHTISVVPSKKLIDMETFEFSLAIDFPKTELIHLQRNFFKSIRNNISAKIPISQIIKIYAVKNSIFYWTYKITEKWSGVAMTDSQIKLKIL